MFDLATAKIRLNLVGNTSQDLILQSAINTVITICENYCKRKFTYAKETAKYYHDSAGYLFVSRYPIEQVLKIDSLNSGSQSIKYRVNKSAGYVDLHGRHTFEEIHVTYAGGYKIYPDDLTLAFWMVFDKVWEQLGTPGAGVTSDIKSVRLDDVGTINYQTSSTHSVYTDKPGTGGMIPIAAINLLDNYRRELA